MAEKLLHFSMKLTEIFLNEFNVSSRNVYLSFQLLYKNEISCCRFILRFFLALVVCPAQFYLVNEFIEETKM